MHEGKMNRGLKNRQLQLMSLGGVIGSGYFLGTGYVLEKAGPAALVSYLLGGMIVMCVMLCLAELAVEKPVSGSFVTYAKEHISPTWACGVGWAYWLNWVAYVPSEMIAAGSIMHKFVPESTCSTSISSASVSVGSRASKSWRSGHSRSWRGSSVSALSAARVISAQRCF